MEDKNKNTLDYHGINYAGGANPDVEREKRNDYRFLVLGAVSDYYIKCCKKLEDKNLVDREIKLYEQIRDEAGQFLRVFSSDNVTDSTTSTKTTFTRKEVEFMLSAFICQHAPHHSQIESPGMFINNFFK